MRVTRAEQSGVAKGDGEKKKKNVLDLSNKELTALPDWDAHGAVQHLNMSKNRIQARPDLRLRGTWPDGVTMLNLSENELTKLTKVAVLPHLRVLNAAKNKIKKVRNLGSCEALSALVLNNNALVNVPPALPASLNTLVLSHNKIVHVKDVGHLKALTKLSLSHNEIAELRPSDLSRNTALQELRLNGNRLTTLPLDLKANYRLRLLDLGNNLIQSKADLKALLSLKRLKNLTLRGNPVLDNDPSVGPWLLKELPALRILDQKKVNEDKKGRADDVSADSDDVLDEDAFVTSARTAQVRHEEAREAQRDERGAEEVVKGEATENEGSMEGRKAKAKPRIEYESGWGKKNSLADLNISEEEETPNRSEESEEEELVKGEKRREGAAHGAEADKDEAEEGPTGWNVVPQWRIRLEKARKDKVKKERKEEDRPIRRERASRGIVEQKERKATVKKFQGVKGREGKEEQQKRQRKGENVERKMRKRSGNDESQRKAPKLARPERGEMQKSKRGLKTDATRERKERDKGQGRKRQREDGPEVAEASSRRTAKRARRDETGEAMGDTFKAEDVAMTDVQAAPSGVVAVTDVASKASKEKFVGFVDEDDPFASVSHW